MVAIKDNLANKANYGSPRSTSKIKFIVIHYTGNDGDSDESNGKYFKNNVVKASAHYFVDDDSITRSVPENYVAWSVGGKKYASCSTTGGGKYYNKCTNNNSISIEICDDVKNGKIYPSVKTIQNTIDLTKTLMEKYNIPAENVIRHFDVTGKLCPAYWCGNEYNNLRWETEFRDKLGGKVETPAKAETPAKFEPYLVKINCDSLNIRAGVGTGYKVTGVIKDKKSYTIVEEKNGWGKLKSGAGWICLKYTKRA